MDTLSRTGPLLALLLPLIVGLQVTAIWLINRSSPLREPMVPVQTVPAPAMPESVPAVKIPPAVAEAAPNSMPVATPTPPSVNNSPAVAAALPPPAPVHPSENIPPAVTTVLPPPAPATAAVSTPPAEPAGTQVKPETAPATIEQAVAPSPEATSVEPEKPTTPATAVKTPSEPAPAEPAKTEQPVQPVSATEQNSSASLRDDAWLKSRSPKRYTLQIQTSSDVNRLQAFVRRNNIPEAAYYRSVRNGTPRYTLVTGEYSSPQAARKGAAELTARLPDLKPLLSDFAAIQAQLR